MKRLSGLLLLVLPLVAAAEVVVPIDTVENHVNIRLSADSTSEIVGRLSQGAHLPLVGTEGEWHEVEIAGGATGFISADWTVVLDEPPVPVTEEQEASDEPETIDADVVAENDTSDRADEVPVVESRDKSTSTSEAAAEVTAEPAESLAEEVETLAESDATDPADPADAVMEAVEEVAGADMQAEVDEAVDSEEPPALAESVDEVAPVIEAEPVAEDTVAHEEAGVHEAQVATAGHKKYVPGENAAGPRGLPGIPGPRGPQGEPGPQGPAGAATIEGSVGFLAKFTSPTIGGTSQVYDNGNSVGIGTTEPKQRLEVNGNIQIHERNSSVAGLMITQSDGDTGYIMHNRASTLTIGAGSVDRITIDRNGNVGFGVARPANPIEMASGAHVTAGGVWTNSSSRARKENISTLSLEDALQALAQLEPVNFNYKNDRSENYVGFIAEDVPDLVATQDRDGLSSMDIVAVLTRVVQEQQKKIAALEARLEQR